ncbi:alpha-L-fucosidase [Paraflavitalea speifideaquila]|uniref:alpha-L-fucosidase n=1 Tax=Paraflavitalea speifideaquila TaxID=3076558 RepID=UPI0028EF4A57|nr:alpha-L-fucosidase [Paraflavitalea speifideiaquila]
MGDYESGYERRLPDPVKNVQVTQIDWEACMTIPENQWGYHKDWSLSYVKTPQELLEMLTLTTSLGGNFLLNFGPQGDGAIRPEEKQIATAIGDWMKLNGEAIYGGDYAGWKKQDWGYYIRKAGTNKVYMVVFNQPVGGIARLQVPDKVKISKSYFLDAPSQSLQLKETQKNQFNLYLPPAKKTGPYIIVLETVTGDKEGPAYQEAKT